jgi:hypothetical protein
VKAVTKSPNERLRTFRSFYAQFFLHPHSTAIELAKDARCVRFGTFAFLVPVVGYFIVYLGLAQSGAYPSKFTPWLAIEAEHYYAANRFLVVPSMFGAWILASGVVQLLGRHFGARGSFENTLGTLGFAISVASWSLLPHDILVGVLGALHVIDGRAHEHAMNAPTIARHLLWFFGAIYVVAFPTYFVKAMRAVHRVGAGAAAILGVSGFVVYQFVFVIFNR